jgi:oligopeptide transport system substrate-binding protein
MTSWVAGSEYVFTKNPDYFKADTVKTEEVVFKYVSDTQSAILSYENGDVDYVKLTGELVDAYKGKEGYTQRLAGYMWYLSVNYDNNEYTSGKYVQGGNLTKALALAIDREAIATSVLKDGSVAAQGIVPSGFATGPDGKDYRDTTDATVSFDAAKAAEYYAAAVQENGGDYTVDLLFEDTEASKAVAEQIQNMWQTNCPGLKVTLNSKPKKTRLDLMQHQQYEVALTRWGPDYADPETFMDLFLSDNWSNNNGHYKSAAYDELVKAAAVNTDSAARWQQYKDAEKILVADDCGVIPVYQSGGAIMINPSVKDIRFHSACVDSYRFMYKTAD